MALHDDLLEQAQQLAHLDPKRPKQANLRRAVSSAYYALFHHLIDESSSFLLGTKSDNLRRQLARNYEHGQMKSAAADFANPKGAGAWRSVLPTPPSTALQFVASTFVQLQEARHDADYNLSRTLSRVEVDALVTQSQTAFARWKTIRGTDEANAFLVALLVKGRR